jgi:hypothetical protein
MEPSPETGRAAAEADRDLVDLMNRAEMFMNTAKVEREKAIKLGDIEKAQELENSMYQMNETIGLLRFNGYSSRSGPSSLVPTARHDVRSDSGSFTPRGSQGHLTGELQRMEKHLPGGHWHDQRNHANRGGALADTIQQQGGVTYNPVRRKEREAPAHGYALSLAKNTEEVVDGPIETAALRARVKSYVRAHWDQIKAPHNYLGGWKDETTGKVYLDISTVIDDLNQAKELARKANQLAIYDLEKNETIEMAA